ncbi:hypothetical protein QH639_00120 [Lysinibacillus sp. 1 U-2021]|uniref:hypothetical protein n=1 Tax=Lysinibacillus sp. 1 U-2021 TaxID=3039426 RepID=UPI002480943D|nr:hypothetical protein [Lysinibacillus sp. 1 U-2021]WGT39276.1 hypothetical protein QH639_00120 [Lysinibacillus sp. 1 U-2021]
MDKIEWETFFTDSMTGIVVLIVSVLIAGITGYFQGKKKSSRGIKRKNEIYQSLLDELLPISSSDPISSSERSLLIKQETHILKEFINNNYKYSLSKKSIKKM